MLTTGETHKLHTAIRRDEKILGRFRPITSQVMARALNSPRINRLRGFTRLQIVTNNALSLSVIAIAGCMPNMPTGDKTIMPPHDAPPRRRFPHNLPRLGLPGNDSIRAGLQHQILVQNERGPTQSHWLPLLG